MIYDSDKVVIRMAKEMGLNHLEFKFIGHLDLQSSKDAAKVWFKVFEKYPEMTYSLVWDCTYMSGFDIEARKIWYDHLKIFKVRIIDVVVISPKILIRGAARVMLEFFGLESRIVKNRKDLLIPA
ncbi:hypothetical protein [Reichenbachiella versicolor]|uniref:hypothetical protein n=1 Tax=Reichenbachiella versicolor TaxID=1821036 RepID=UPI000D6DDD9E|nr:hypothetical protein [Reichenbachiella versicolor]